MPDDDAKQDKWADWLLRGRQRGCDTKQVRRMNRHLERLGRRVVREARLRPGELVLDVGAGTGLLAFEACRRVTETGRVVAFDFSHDALSVCRENAETGAPLSFVTGDAVALPFPDETFAAVMTRSVLIYLEDKPAGVRELHRVLKRDGRASIFEPINDLWRTTQARLRETGHFDSFQPIYDRLMEHYTTSASATFLGWDERDLVSWFEDAGFRQVKLTYEHTSARPGPPQRITDKAREQLRSGWRGRPNPHDPSFEELVRTMLGDEADDFLDRFLEFTLANPAPSAAGVAYLTARR